MLRQTLRQNVAPTREEINLGVHTGASLGRNVLKEGSQLRVEGLTSHPPRLKDEYRGHLAGNKKTSLGYVGWSCEKLTFLTRGDGLQAVLARFDDMPCHLPAQADSIC